MIWNPVYSVSTPDVACSAAGEKLFGPEYFASNAGCCWRMRFPCTETQNRSQKLSSPAEEGAGVSILRDGYLRGKNEKNREKKAQALPWWARPPAVSIVPFKLHRTFTN